MSQSLIDLCCALTILIAPRLLLQSRKAHLLQTLLNIRAESLPISDIIYQLLVIRHRRLANALPQHILHPLHLSPNDHQTKSEQSLLWLGLSRLKNLATESVQKPIGSSESSGLFGKLKSKAEGWKDSDAAAVLSKRATNWSIMASSWCTPSVVLKHTPEPPPTSSSPAHLDSSPSPGSSRWSKVSSASTLSLDGPFHPPISLASSLSCSSSTISSPIHPTPTTHAGPKPLLLSARARTNVPLGPEPNGSVKELVTSSLKRLSALKLGPQSHAVDNERVVQRLKPIVTCLPATDLHLLSPSLPLTGIGGLGRHWARSVLTSPTSEQEHGQMASKSNGRISLPEIHSPSSEWGVTVEPVVEVDERVEMENGMTPTTKTRSRTLMMIGQQKSASNPRESGDGQECDLDDYGQSDQERVNWRESSTSGRGFGGCGDELNDYLSLYDC